MLAVFFVGVDWMVQDYKCPDLDKVLDFLERSSSDSKYFMNGELLPNTPVMRTIRGCSGGLVKILAQVLCKCTLNSTYVCSSWMHVSYMCPCVRVCVCACGALSSLKVGLS